MSDSIGVPLNKEELKLIKDASKYLHLIHDLTYEEHQRLDTLRAKIEKYHSQLTNQDILNQQVKITQCRHSKDGQTTWGYVRLNQILHEWLCSECGGIAWTDSEERTPKSKDVVL